MITQMKEKLNNPELETKLIPTWNVGCRRFTPRIGYLETLGKSNVSVVHGEIQEITEKGCTSADGIEHPLDILICATGFDTSFVPRFPIINRAGTNLQDTWATLPASYLGIAAPEFPNYLIFLGPNYPIGNGPVLSAIEAQADYMLRLIDIYQTENISRFTPRTDAVRDFIAHKDAFMPRAVSLVVQGEPGRWVGDGALAGFDAALYRSDEGSEVAGLGYGV